MLQENPFSKEPGAGTVGMVLIIFLWGKSQYRFKACSDCPQAKSCRKALFQKNRAPEPLE